MGEERKVIHYNPKLQHQCDHAEAFAKCGFRVTIDPKEDADVHVISGPHYAKRFWLNHPRVLEIDRAWWGDPDCVSIGWSQADGTRRFAVGGEPRPKPQMDPWHTGEDSCLILADYGQDVTWMLHDARKRFDVVNIRRHPADKKPDKSLETELLAHDVALAKSGTGLFEAIRLGKPSICLDEKSECAPVCSGSIDAPLYRGERYGWLHTMSYKQFNLNEIEVAWELLRDIQ